MKYVKSVTVLVIVIAIFALVAALYGIFSTDGPGRFQFTSISGETVEVDGHGLYQHDSVSAAAQARAQDVVTVIVGLPLLLSSLLYSRKGWLKARLLLAGTLGYFLYTYASYSFLSMYNPFFLIYVLLFSASLYAFILTMMSFDTDSLGSLFDSRMPVRFIGGFLLFMAFTVGMMWSGRIIPSLMAGVPPVGLEHYSSLAIQVLDLGLVAPTSVLAGILVIKRKPFGYLLASVVIIKGITMLTAITAMIIGQMMVGVSIGYAELVLFPAFNLIVIYPLVLIMKNTREPLVTHLVEGR